MRTFSTGERNIRAVNGVGGAVNSCHRINIRYYISCLQAKKRGELVSTNAATGLYVHCAVIGRALSGRSRRCLADFLLSPLEVGDNNKSDYEKKKNKYMNQEISTKCDLLHYVICHTIGVKT